MQCFPMTIYRRKYWTLKKPDGKNTDAFWEKIPENSMDNQDNEQINQCFQSQQIYCVWTSISRNPQPAKDQTEIIILSTYFTKT